MSASNQQQVEETHRGADQATRTSFVNNLSMQTIFVPHPPSEEAIINQVKQNLSTSKDEEVQIDDNPFFSKVVGFKDGIGIGTCTGVVQTSPEELLGFMYLTNTHEARESHIAANGPDSSKYPNKTIRVINDHHQIVYSCRKLPPPLKARDWLTRNLFQRVNANTIKYFSTSIHDDDPDIPPGSFTKTTMTNIVRGASRSQSPLALSENSFGSPLCTQTHIIPLNYIFAHSSLGAQAKSRGFTRTSAFPTTRQGSHCS